MWLALPGLAGRLACAALLILGTTGAGGGAVARGAVPAPAEVLGFEPGEDYRLASFQEVRQYFSRLDAASERVQLFSAGQSTDGNDMLVAVISSEDNLAALERHRDTARRLARARGITEDAARRLAATGRAIVWIDSGLHSSEVATVQHALLLAHRVATDESEEMRAIRDNVILLLLPCINPDGTDLQVDWYRRTLRTPHQDSPMPWLYQRYVGHDNNRDSYMQTQAETRVLNRLLFRDWLPQVMYNQHQGTWPPRIFVPPFPDPFNPNIDPQIMRSIDLVGGAMLNRFEREGKDGVVSRYTFSTWYNGSVRTTSYFHNIVGILTETGHASATPFTYDPAQFPAQLASGVPSLEPSSDYPRPWRGGTLRLRDAVDYMLTGSMGVLEVAAKYREAFLLGIHQVGARQIRLGDSEAPVAYVIPPAQHDPPAVLRFIETLMLGQVEVHRARAAFDADGHSFPAGSHVVRLAQPFRPFAKDMLEPQRYPDVRRQAGGPPEPPYDTAGWTLSYQMGVEAIPVAKPFDAELDLLDAPPEPAGVLETAEVARPWGYAIDPRTTNAFIAVNRLLAGGADVRRARDAFSPAPGVTLPAGAWIVRAGRPRADRAPQTASGTRTWGRASALPETSTRASALPDSSTRASAQPDAALEGQPLARQPSAHGTAVRLADTADPHASVFTPHPAAVAAVPTLVRDLGLKAWTLRSEPGGPLERVALPRVGLYKSWVANMDEGWTRWIFEQYAFPYRTLHDGDIRADDLRNQFDVIVLPDQSASRMLNGHQPTDGPGSRPAPWGPVPPAYQGGIGELGLEALQAFVREGGTIVALDEASDLLLDRFGQAFAGIRDVTRGVARRDFYCPGSVLRIRVDTGHPVGYGMPPETAAYFAGSRAFAATDPAIRSIARYDTEADRLLMSGWLLGAPRIAGMHAALEVPYGRGRAVLFAFRPQFRAQSHATFKMLFNAVMGQGRLP